MRRLGTHYTGKLSSAPAVCVLVYDGTSHEPSLCLTQEGKTDIPILTINGVKLECTAILDDIAVKSTRPTTGGGLRRNTATISFRTNNSKAYPYVDSIFSKEIYYGGKNYESVYFVIYSFDRANQNQDLKNAACYGAYQIRDDLSWEEDSGVMSISMVDIITAQEQFAGATDEKIDDIFYIYNSWYQGSIFPKVYGQVPRIKLLNAFPTFDIKKLSASISGILHTDYDTSSLSGAELVLETDVSAGSLLLQLVAIGGTVRIKFANGEVMAGALSHDTGTNEIIFTVATRNTYYNQIGGWTDSKDGRTPDQWGAHPNYTDVDFVANSTIIPDAKNVILDPDGWMQADIHFYDPGAPDSDRLETNVKTQMRGLLTERKDSVLHDYWPDPDNAGTITDTTLSAYYDGGVGNETYLSPDQVPIWGLTSYRFMNFFGSPQNVRLFFIDPDTALAEGHVGDQWNLVGVEPASVDYSCYIRNGFSKFDADHVFCEGEGRLIKIPTLNISSITQSGTFYGLDNLCKITLTTSPLDMNIGATSNTIYVDALYVDDSDTDSWLPAIVNEFISQECAGGLDQLMSTQITDPSEYPTANQWPYIGIYISNNEKVTDILDKICYQCGVSMHWDLGLFSMIVSSVYFDNYEVVETTGPDKTYIKPKLRYTDQNEMIEKSACLTIGRLKTALANGLEHIQLHYKATYGGWQDPYYSAVKSEINRTIKPRARYVEYHYDYINDPDSFKQAVALSLSIGSASAYSSIQRKIVTEMTMDGCRWEALDPIVFKDFPLLSTEESNVTIDPDDGKLMWEKPVSLDEDDVDTISPHFLMGAVGCVDEVEYLFNILNPTVRLTARMSQLNVDDVSGVTYYNSPGAPNLPSVPTNPNSPPNAGGGSNGPVGYGVGGNNILMPEVFTPPEELIIDTTDMYSKTINLTVDSGWLYDLGWDYYAEVIDPKGTNGVAIDTGGSGTFPNKLSDAYVPPVFNIGLRIYYFWFESESLGTTDRECKIKITRRYHVTKNPDSEIVEDFFYIVFNIKRRPLAEIDYE